MHRAAIRIYVVAMLALSAFIFAMPEKSSATIQGDMCWEPDVEFPMPCDDDDDEVKASRLQVKLDPTRGAP